MFALAVIATVSDVFIFAWLVYVDWRDRRENRVSAICPECLEEHYAPRALKPPR